MTMNVRKPVTALSTPGMSQHGRHCRGFEAHTSWTPFPSGSRAAPDAAEDALRGAPQQLQGSTPAARAAVAEERRALS